MAGAQPMCRLSHRAEAALAHIRGRLAFVDAELLPIVSDGRDRIVIWAFAGGAATASIAAGLADQGVLVIGFDDLTVALRGSDPQYVAKALRCIDQVSIHPKLPEDLASSLKFGLCLPVDVISSVLKARTSDAAAVAATCRRNPRVIFESQSG